MNGRIILRIALAVVVASTVLSGGVVATDACDGGEVDCWADADADTGDERERTVMSAGAAGGADLNDPEDVTTHHVVHVSVTTGIVDLDADAGVER